MSDELVVEKNVHLIARNPNEMALSRQCLADWLTVKIASCESERMDLEEIRNHAKKNKWRTSGLERQVGLANKRLLFYTKVKEAVDQGFTIVPNFPADIFAIRVTRNYPLQKTSSSNYRNPMVSDENPSHAAIGEGNYVSPEAKLSSWDGVEKNSKGEEITRYFSRPMELQDVEFPVACARPEIMSAVSEAMSLNLFDSFAIAPQGVMRKRKYDPIILGQVILPKQGGYAAPKVVSFLIAWHLDLRTL